MFANERYNTIMQMIHTRGSVTAAELTARFGTSVETVRRDLCYLEKKGMLTRVHGGAVSVNGFNKFVEYADRLLENRAEKHALCSTAMQFIEENDTIFLDCGTTAIELARLICEQRGSVTVVTNSTAVPDILAPNGGIQVFLAGGRYVSKEQALTGSLTVESLQVFHAAKAFIFPGAINTREGVCCADERFVEIHRAMMRGANRVFLLADGSKLGKSAFYKVCPLDEHMTVITDEYADKSQCLALEKKGVYVIK